jgi:hypothetical protein
MKLFLVIVLLTITTMFTFADENYVVKDVVGTVTAETIPIKIGDILLADQKVSVGLNSRLTVVGPDGVIYTMNTIRSGLLSAIIQIKGSVVRINGRIMEVNTSTTGRNFRPPSTASARASEVAQDYLWEE